MIEAVMDAESAGKRTLPADGSCGEADLLAALRDRDPLAFEAFVRQFGGQMFATASTILISKEDAADAVQEAFLSAFQAIDRFEGNSKIGTWLHRIVVNACLMRLRARRSEVPIENLLPTFDSTGHQTQVVHRWKHATEEQLAREETRSLVRRCIDALPDDYRMVLILRDVDGLSTYDAAQALQISPGAVKTRLHRARQALRTLLDPFFSS